jgi:hypothetical protein
VLETPSRPHLQNRSVESRSLRQNQAISIEQRLRDHRFDRRAVLRRTGVERRCNQRSAHQAPRRWQSTDRLKYLFFARLVPELQRLLQLRVIKSSSVDVLRMDGQLCDSDPHRAMHLPGPLYLRHRLMPFLLGLVHLGRQTTLRRRALCRARIDQPDDLARARNYPSVQGQTFPVCQHNIVKCNLDGSRWREVGV